MVLRARRSSGPTIRMSAIRPPRKWPRVVNTISAICAERNSATRRTRLALARIAASSPRLRSGTVRWRSRPCAQRCLEATSACATTRALRDSCCPCATRARALLARPVAPRLERAIGVIYRPKTELESHYFQAVLPRQFDEYIWFDESNAVTPLQTQTLKGLPETYPFGL